MLNLNVTDSLTGAEPEKEQQLMRRHEAVSAGKIVEKNCRKHGVFDYTTIYSPNGQSSQRAPLNKQALQVHAVAHW